MEFDKCFIQAMNSYSLISLEVFEKLPTPRKLAYFKKKRGWEHNGFCDCGCGERIHSDENNFFRDCDHYVGEMRRILNKCEHVL